MSVFLAIDHSEWVASNELAFAVWDAFPVSPGHTLVVPRRLVTTWWDASRDEQHALLALVDAVKRRLDVEFSPSGYNVGFNAGVAAGQTVNHLHVHVIPRFDGDMEDPRGGVRHVIPERGNYLADKGLSPTRVGHALITPADGRMRLELLRCFLRDDLDQIDLVVSFVKRSGVNLIARHLDEALDRGVHLRLLTTDYLGVTDPAGLGFFLDRLGKHQTGHLEVKIFSDPMTSFHPKAYIFTSSSTGAGIAFVGSSNLTWTGISQGVEWNVQTSGTDQLIEEFERLWSDRRSVPLSAEWLESYERRLQERMAAARLDANGLSSSEESEINEEPAEVLRPWSVQSEALAALEATRIDGHQAGLVVMATGLGKTWLAAFDSTRPQFGRVLFVAHREEILSQARDVYRSIRPSGQLTFFGGTRRDADGEVVFASIQSLQKHVSSFAPDDFDYIVIDEFHHAAALTYRKVIGHFQPQFLLGLTATPSRADNADLLALCGDNLVYECGLVEGVSRGLLSPFRYRAIADVADYEHIPWRNGRFETEALTSHVATQERAMQVLDEWRSAGGESRRALGFCCSVVHADFMAGVFRDHGVRAVSVHSGSSSPPRAESLERLAVGDLEVIFTVDLFNEGVDIPAVDLILMLRPTESPVVFLQQLGRGLRRAEGKEVLDVIDLVGNHRGFLLKARVLAQLVGYPDLTDREAVQLLAAHQADLAEHAELPEGCSIVVELEAVELLNEMLGATREVDRVVELIRQWTDDHGGERPTALEIALQTGRAYTLKAKGGWFGLLNDLGLLSSDEQQVFTQLREYFLWIEHGNYSKSFKLLTLQAMVQQGGVNQRASVSELAALTRWRVLNDPDLLADLADATSAFVDVTRPTSDEWDPYWRRNPIQALTSATRGKSPWFAADSRDIWMVESVPDDLRSTLDAMTMEIVDYRLHRYLVTQSARRVGESRQPVVDGVEFDATFTVEADGPVATSVVIESAGGVVGTDTARNVQYVDGVDVVLQRLAAFSIDLVDAYVDSRRTSNLPVADRRLDLPAGLAYPVDLHGVIDLTDLRKSLLRSMTRVGRDPNSKGGGNARKRMRLVVATESPLTAAQLAEALRTGEPPVPHLKPPVSDRDDSLPSA